MGFNPSMLTMINPSASKIAQDMNAIRKEEQNTNNYREALPGVKPKQVETRVTHEQITNPQNRNSKKHERNPLIETQKNKPLMLFDPSVGYVCTSRVHDSNKGKQTQLRRWK